MTDTKENRIYKDFDPLKGYPSQEKLFWECLRCGDVLPSAPKDSVHCRCHNVSIDIDYGRTVIEDQAQAKLFCLPG